MASNDEWEGTGKAMNNATAVWKEAPLRLK